MAADGQDVRLVQEAKPENAREVRKTIAGNRKLYTDVPLALAFLLTAGSVTLLLLLPQLRGSDNLFFMAPAQVVLGAIILLSMFLMVVVGFRRMSLHDRNHALALPDGSIRALIAILLLVIFVALGNTIFGTLTSGSQTRFTAITAAQVEEMRQEPGVTVTVTERSTATQGGQTVELLSGTVTRPRDDDAKNLGSQIVTALLTLVTAVSAFYFGANNVQKASSAVAATKPDEGRPRLAILKPKGAPALFPQEGAALRIELNRDDTEVLEVKGDDTATVAFDDEVQAYVFKPTVGDRAVEIVFGVRSDSNERVTLRLRPRS